MTASTQQLDQAIDALRALAAGTRPDQLDDPTPCAKWDVRGLLNHFVGGGHLFAGMFRGEIDAFPEGEGPDMVGDDHVASVDAAIADFRDGIGSPGALERTIAMPFGPMPAEFVVGLMTWDLTVHCWDLARATGQAFPLSEQDAASADAFARGFLAPELRDGDTFGAEVEVGDGASAVDRLAAFAGRQP